MQHIDAIMHVTPNRSATVAALAMFYNPSLVQQTTSLLLPLYSGLSRHFVVKTVFPCVANRANMLYLVARTNSRAAVCVHATRIAA